MGAVQITSAKSVLLLGATGLIGSECLKLLAADSTIDRIVVLTRRPFNAASSPRVECYQVNFDDPDSLKPAGNIDAVICTLGTTIRKAGSQDAFRRVDFDYPFMAAKLARDAGANHYLLVTSMGADANARNFYLRVKGELEDAIANLGYPALSIFRPSLLLGPREEFRFGELISQKVLGAISFMMPRSVRPISAACVARSIVRSLLRTRGGTRIITNHEMIQDCTKGDI